MEWRTGEPPIDREVEYETVGGVRGRGHLERNGFGVADTLAEANRRMREQFRLKDDRDHPFDVARWREVQT